MTGQLRLTLAQRRKLAKVHAHRHQPDRTRLSRRQFIAVALIWLAVFVAALWLAAHDPEYLSRVAERAVGGAA